MAKSETQTIKLGERKFVVRPLKLGEMRAVEKVVGTAGTGVSGIEFAARVFVAGLPDHNLTEEEILDMTVPRYELDEGASELLRMLGWSRPEQGEAGPQTVG